ncbi:uncharacterized protein TNCV_635391 [Trichonephila clavipes]|nr:uncharacterized protein TNCV_635391 [Trichonephila clavipes]
MMVSEVTINLFSSRGVDSGQELFPLPERRQPLRNGDARQGPYLPPALLHVRLLQRAPHAGGHLRAAGQLRLLPLPLRHDNAGVPLLPAANGGVRRTLRPRRAARHRLGEERQAAEEEERRPRRPDSDEAHFWLNGYVNKQNYRIWSEANPQVYIETPLHPEKQTVRCALWAGGILPQKR